MSDAVDRYFAAWSSLDPSAYVACFDENAVVHDPYGSTPHKGASALRKFFGGIAHAIQDVSIQADSVYAAGDHVAVVFRGKAIGKNLKPVEVAGIDVFEFNEGGPDHGVMGLLGPCSGSGQAAAVEPLKMTSYRCGTGLSHFLVS